MVATHLYDEVGPRKPMGKAREAGVERPRERHHGRASPRSEDHDRLHRRAHGDPCQRLRHEREPAGPVATPRPGDQAQDTAHGSSLVLSSATLPGRRRIICLRR